MKGTEIESRFWQDFPHPFITGPETHQASYTFGVSNGSGVALITHPF